jgi:hypothetical protein
VHAIAKVCCRGDIPKAIGHLQCLLSELPAHARDGSMAAIDDHTIEQWALWRGKAGWFAAAIRGNLCDEIGTLRSWERYNGGPIREAARNLQNVRAHRGRKRDVSGVSPVTPSLTERNGTKINCTSTALAKSVCVEVLPNTGLDHAIRVVK